jgi:hypothetical protein
LVELCEEMHRYGAIIEAPEIVMPTCNQPNRGGLHVELSPDGSRYIVTYQEKDMIDLIIESDDSDQVLEAIFSEVTANMVPMHLPPRPPMDMETLQIPKDVEDLRRMAISTHLESSRIQEDLLGKLNSDWRQRQEIRNAQQLENINAMLDNE